MIYFRQFCNHENRHGKIGIAALDYIFGLKAWENDKKPKMNPCFHSKNGGMPIFLQINTLFPKPEKRCVIFI